ncbi:hypothetical protein BCT30_02360 [Enterovibrio norvegicus]|uniref:DUF1415 domain-containing protein n=1 Tax=Enterovibrio norvegicus DSM 15893 TaxID=1121869 RepID=A0A1I5PWP1_9GAMM|nr:DUF1415 domain-containing protein [Enterovibrio norvegicus]MCC4798385.1 DUF1415 domain-containing protein [Enterovibrio norvegicus]OEE49594.1 hypothetical protein A1OS_00365 [Enterovibrio norvegicus]OEF48794.1 hypothetical protein A1OW_14130 [Enterovibrio norvegicus]PMH65316.1 hypothetical protein BCU62_13435 [Enterovibrio norvegicus]PMI33207.1 hypothetical protein BCU46_03775 [Enterovibrio norvegicus]
MTSTHTVSLQDVEAQTTEWLEKVVIGLNLCPFAAKPQRNKQIKIEVCEGNTDEAVMETLLTELNLLESSDVADLETTLLVTPNYFQDFDDYNQFLDVADMIIEQFGWRGIYQIASFHPDYCFADAEPDDESNLTNRSPYPVFHLIREASIEKALKYYGGDADAIPDINIDRVCSLSNDEKKALFPYLFRTHG